MTQLSQMTPIQQLAYCRIVVDRCNASHQEVPVEVANTMQSILSRAALVMSPAEQEAAMQHELSAITGATPTGRSRKAGSRCCSTEAKYESQSMNKAVPGS